MKIGITNLKGGVGKSTITQNLAVCFAHLGFKTVIVDTDTNQNSLAWFAARDKNLPTVNVVGVTESDALSKSVENLHQDYDILLIDGTPNPIPTYFILNEFSEHKKVHEGISSQIESSFDVPVLNTRINSRVAYTEVSIDGQGVFEYSDQKAKAEMVSLMQEALEIAKELQFME
ncbi:MAG: ParA family protein [Bacteroidota bacterium]